MNKHKILSIKDNSIAEEMGIEPGDFLISINDTEIDDVFDYHYLVNDDYLEVLIEKGTGNEDEGEEWLLEVDKDYDEELGIELEKNFMDDYRSCHNKCIFCFIDQMPKGMRETLYFKDDDSRLSFLQGNYITLTNMKDKDIDKIIKYHLCPINISVHTTNKELRCKMLNNRFAGDALDKIDKLYQASIEMNGQIVLCKGVNDGDELDKTIRDLSLYLPHMHSLSVVPSGLTKFRDGLYPLEPFTKEDAIKVIDTVERWQKNLKEQYGVNFVHASDEWYILAGMDFPEEERYDGYLQLENGVGMMRLLYNEVEEELLTHSEGELNKEISIATGYLAYNMITKLSKLIMDKYKGLKINVYPIRNDFFGDTITVSGLVTGGDLISQLQDKNLGEVLLIPKNMLRSGEDVFLDDVTLSEAISKLKVPVGITGSTGKDFVCAIVNNKYESIRDDNRIVYNKQYD